MGLRPRHTSLYIFVWLWIRRNNFSHPLLACHRRSTRRLWIWDEESWTGSECSICGSRGRAHQRSPWFWGDHFAETCRWRKEKAGTAPYLEEIFLSQHWTISWRSDFSLLGSLAPFPGSGVEQILSWEQNPSSKFNRNPGTHYLLLYYYLPLAWMFVWLCISVISNVPYVLRW